ncbi:MAG: ankyrin repeat domain-containing protein [Chlamydiota bacterium]|nr:ankyrin repeat domain-containing protein [Chlamydiota bacterium]
MLDIRLKVHSNDIPNVKTIIKKVKTKREFNLDMLADEFSDPCRDAILLQNKEMVQLFLDQGLYVGSKAHLIGDRGEIETLLYFATRVGSLPIVKMLVDKGAKIKGKEMSLAIETSRLEIVRCFLDNGINPKGMMYRTDYYGTYLGNAAYQGNRSMVDLLVSYGANVRDAIDSNNYNRRRSMFTDSGSIRINEFRWVDLTKPPSEDRAKLNKKYAKSFKILLDSAFGVNFEKEKSSIKGLKTDYNGLAFLQGVNIKKFNFVGVSYCSKPITRELLIEKGFVGSDQAILTINDIKLLSNEQRRDSLLSRMESIFQKYGKIIDQNGIVNMRPLTSAVEQGCIEEVKFRLVSGVDPNELLFQQGYKKSISAISLAAQKGYFDIVKLLAAQPSIDQSSVLSVAAYVKSMGFTHIYGCLIDSLDPNILDRKGNAQIHEAVLEKDINRIKRLLDGKADINLKNKSGETPLTLAINRVSDDFFYCPPKHEDVILIQFLLDRGADVNISGSFYPLTLAAQIGSLEILKLLLPLADTRKLTENWGCLSNSWCMPLLHDSLEVESDDWLKIVDLFKEYDEGLFEKTHEWECGEGSIFHLYFRYSHLFNIAWVRSLLEKGVNPSLSSESDQENALHEFLLALPAEIVEEYGEQVIDLFIEYGLDINSSTKQGSTALDIASNRRYSNIVNCLIKNGAEVNA